MSISRLTGEGQVTIPLDIQAHLKLQPGSRIEFVIDTSGEVKILPLNVPIAKLAGILHRPGRPALSIEEMNQAVQEQIH
ncbi:AbrB family transcriptional regulator [Leptolyngbya sp. NIES-3755]|nr:AbrB family transcriptional regulator [Leptolyngbya sp. NIES-3755]